MNTMGSAAAIALAARGVSLTINAPAVAGELAVLRAAAMVAAGRAERILAGGVDQLDPRRSEMLALLGGGQDRAGEGATFLVLEALDTAVARGARVLGEVLGGASGALAASPHGIGRSTRPLVVARALARAGAGAGDVGWVYASASGDRARDAWERTLLARALAPERPATTSLASLVGHHAGLGAMRVAAAAWTARAGLLPVIDGAAGDGRAAAVRLERVLPGPGLVHGIARGGTHVALVVGPALAP
jgi:3-oxoacyl-[acyl-carrier-protein] synthase II